MPCILQQIVPLRITDIVVQSFPASGDEDNGDEGYVDSCVRLSNHADHLNSSSTQSLTNSVWTFTRENGRTYHGYRAGGK